MRQFQLFAIQQSQRQRSRGIDISTKLYFENLMELKGEINDTLLVPPLHLMKLKLVLVQNRCH